MPAHAVDMDAPWDKVADDARKTLVLTLMSRKRAPLVTAAALAEYLQVAPRTLYRALERWGISLRNSSDDGASGDQTCHP